MIFLYYIGVWKPGGGGVGVSPAKPWLYYFRQATK